MATECCGCHGVHAETFLDLYLSDMLRIDADLEDGMEKSAEHILSSMVLGEEFCDEGTEGRPVRVGSLRSWLGGGGALLLHGWL